MTVKPQCLETALEIFCRVHWHRLHRLARQRGCSEPEAEDAVQDLFLTLSRLGLLDDLLERREQAQFSYLSMRLRSLLMNRWRDEHRQRRGGRIQFVSLDDETVKEPLCHETPATLHDRAWLGSCIDAAVKKLQQQTRATTWAHISPLLLGVSEEVPSSTQRVALHRARKKLRGLVREQMNGSFKDWSQGLLKSVDC